MRAIALGVLCVVLAASCSSAERISGDRRNVGNLTITFKVEPARAKPGQVVRFTVRAVNNGGTPVELTFPSGQRYDFWVTARGDEVWRWSEGMMFTQDVATEVIEGQGGLTFSESWTAEAGSFVAHGVLSAQAHDDALTGRLEVE